MHKNKERKKIFRVNTTNNNYTYYNLNYSIKLLKNEQNFKKEK